VEWSLKCVCCRIKRRSLSGLGELKGADITKMLKNGLARLWEEIGLLKRCQLARGVWIEVLMSLSGLAQGSCDITKMLMNGLHDYWRRSDFQSL
jgi:hypothetical protein